MKSNPRFFIFGYFGWFNVGDDAIGLSVVKELKRRYPDATFTVTCNDPYFVENFHETNISRDVEIIGFEISKILREVVKSDYFIITGGTHFHDEGKLKFGRFKILLSFVMLTCYARISKKSPILFGHGIGPLSSSWSKVLVKVILYNSEKVFVRDEDSFELVTSLGFSEKCVQGFDCTATLIEASPVLSGVTHRQSEQRIIGVSLLPVYSIYSNDVEKDVSIVKSFARCLDSVLLNDNSICLRLFAFRTGTRHSDVPLLEALMKNINVRPNAIELVHYDGDVRNFLSSIEECDYCVGMRYHASVFAYLLHKPQIILDYMGKCKSLGRDIAIDETAIIPIADILKPGFCSKVQSFLSDSDRYIANLPVHSAKKRAEKMFEILGEKL
jgi:polysaccharide pyruvyl transferase WcaK-like protein